MGWIIGTIVALAVLGMINTIRRQYYGMPFGISLNVPPPSDVFIDGDDNNYIGFNDDNSSFNDSSSFIDSSSFDKSRSNS